IDLVNPMMVMEFNCGELVGTMEAIETEVRDGKKHENREMINWNTNVGNNYQNQRFERIISSRQSVYDTATASYKLEHEFREISRVSKVGMRDLEIRNYRFNTRKNGSVYFDHVEK